MRPENSGAFARLTGVDELALTIVGALATAVVLGFVLWATRRLAPPGDGAGDVPPLEELQRRYARWVLIELAVLAVCIPLCAAAWLFALTAFAGRARAADAMFQQVPDGRMWAPPALVFGLLTAPLPDVLVMRGLLGGGRLREYVRLHGVDTKRWLLIIAAPLLLIFVPYVGVLFDTYSYFDREGLVVNEAFNLREERRPYSTITAVQERTDAEFGSAMGYAVVFADGSRWRPTEEGAAIIELVCERSGRPLEKVQVR